MTDRAEAARRSEVDAEELRELTTVVAYACVGWWAIAGAASLYWADGGSRGLWSLWNGRAALGGAGAPWLESLLWGLASVELALACLALLVARGWTPAGVRVVVNASAFAIGLTLVPFVAVETVLGGLVWLDLLERTALDRTAQMWSLLFWNPWWVLGVLSFCATAWLARYSRGPSQRSDDGA